MSDLNESPVPESPTPLSSAALARRHMLLKSLGKGSAALAVAAVPMHTLANTPTLVMMDGTRCSISGMQSGNHSRMGPTSTCVGKSPGYWHTYSHWIPAQRNNWNVKFGVMFGDDSPLKDFTLYDIVCSIGNQAGTPPPPGVLPGPDHPVFSPGAVGKKFNNRPEWHWCSAWMNAVASNIAGTGVIDYPYTPAQVIAIYQDPEDFHGVTREFALNFFKKTWGGGD